MYIYFSASNTQIVPTVGNIASTIILVLTIVDMAYTIYIVA